tara:strand:- start:696 stop:950 length:255 start_codon:yes stop_codon:yes gene_type:complete
MTEENKTDSADKETTEEGQESEPVRYLNFTEEIFDSIYNSVEQVAALAIKNRAMIDEFMQIVTALDERTEKLENSLKEEDQTNE